MSVREVHTPEEAIDAIYALMDKTTAFILDGRQGLDVFEELAAEVEARPAGNNPFIIVGQTVTLMFINIFAEELMRRSAQALNRIARAAGHELKYPLTPDRVAQEGHVLFNKFSGMPRAEDPVEAVGGGE